MSLFKSFMKKYENKTNHLISSNILVHTSSLSVNLVPVCVLVDGDPWPLRLFKFLCSIRIQNKIQLIAMWIKVALLNSCKNIDVPRHFCTILSYPSCHVMSPVYYPPLFRYYPTWKRGVGRIQASLNGLYYVFRERPYIEIIKNLTYILLKYYIEVELLKFSMFVFLRTCFQFSKINQPIALGSTKYLRITLT